MSLPQAKLTWPGSETTFGFWQAVVISLCTVATLGGHDGPFLNTTIAPMVSSTTPAADAIGDLATAPGAGLPGRAPAPVDEHLGPVAGRAPPVLRDGPGVPGRGRAPCPETRGPAGVAFVRRVAGGAQELPVPGPAAPSARRKPLGRGWPSYRPRALSFPAPRRLGELAGPRLPPLEKAPSPDRGP